MLIWKGVFTYLAIKNDWLGDYYSYPELNYHYAPVIAVVLGVWIIAKLFFDAYDMACDTILMCVLEDLEQFNGSPEKPYHMSKELQKLVVQDKSSNIADERKMQEKNL